MLIFDCRLAMAQFFGLDKVAKLRTIIKVSLPGIIIISIICFDIIEIDQRICLQNVIYHFQDHGGVKAALYHLYWTDDLKVEQIVQNCGLPPLKGI